METTTNEQKDELISTFLEIAAGHTMETALHCLNASRWNLEEAINFFLIHKPNLLQFSDREGEQQVPPPILSKKDILYDYSSFMNHTSVAPEQIWDSTSQSSHSVSVESSGSRLSSLYRLPSNLLFKGSFEEAKSTSYRENRWLLVNLQSTTEFASHSLNRDLWSNEAISQTIQSNFVLLQVYDHIMEGKKISTFYKLQSPPPVVLLIDPITGQHIRSWIGVIDPQSFLEDLMIYSDVGPHEHITSKTSFKPIRTEDKDKSTLSLETCSPNNHVSPSWGSEFDETMTLSDHEEEEEEETCLYSDQFEFPDLTEEPNGDCDRSIVCSLCVRFPDGRRKQRKFLKNEPIQLLWSFCSSFMEASEKKTFKLVQAVPGASKTLDYGSTATFDQSGIDNSMISVTWE